MQNDTMVYEYPNWNLDASIEPIFGKNGLIESFKFGFTPIAEQLRFIEIIKWGTITFGMDLLHFLLNQDDSVQQGIIFKVQTI